MTNHLLSLEHGVFNAIDNLAQETRRFIENENILESKEDARDRLEHYEMALWCFRMIDKRNLNQK